MIRKNKLEKLRMEIDSLDKHLVVTLSKRKQVSAAIGEYKKLNKLQPLDSKRWQEVVDSRIEMGKALGLSPALVRSIFEIIHNYSLKIQKEKVT